MINPESYCLLLLKRRLRSGWELSQGLSRRGVEEAERKMVLQRLEEVGLINDRRFAQSWVNTRDLLAPRGEFLLRGELIKKGISQEIIEAVLSARKEKMSAFSPTEEEQLNEEALGRRLLAGKKRLYAHLAPEVRYRRQMGLLQRRGFSYQTIRRILNA